MQRWLKFKIALRRAKQFHSKLVPIIIRDSSKTIVLDLNDQDYLRYLYVLCLMLRDQDYHIILLTGPKNLAKIMVEKYASNLLKLDKISISNKINCTLTTTSIYLKLNSDYFKNTAEYKVPICQHPKMYEQGLDKPVTNLEKKKVLFFA